MLPSSHIFQTERDGDTLVLTPKVNLSELEYAQSMTEDVIALFADATIKNLVIDFHKTDYFGSTALGFFIRLWKRIQERKGRMVLCNLSDHEKEILQVTKLDECWPQVDSRAEAIKFIKTP
jgi:anti-anti-sigma factor